VVTTQILAIANDIGFAALRRECRVRANDEARVVNLLKGYSIVRAIAYTARKT
jgi:hypothetical protein